MLQLLPAMMRQHAPAAELGEALQGILDRPSTKKTSCSNADIIGLAEGRVTRAKGL